MLGNEEVFVCSKLEADMKISIPPETCSSCSSDNSIGVVFSRLDMVATLDMSFSITSRTTYFWEILAYAN